MSKKIISVVLVLAIIATLVIVFDPFKKENTVTAATFRNGLNITPTKQDPTGVLTDTSFILELEEGLDFTKEYIESSIYLDDITLAVEKTKERTYLITPKQLLKEGKVYIIGIKDPDGNDTTWAFQTTTGLKIISYFPADKSTYVPINTGIEIYFNQGKFDNYTENFVISPKVEGIFEVHKNVLVFVPKELLPNTIYTVTIKKGINITDSSAVLLEDNTFSFATAPDEKTNNPDYDKGYFMFQRDLSEYSTLEDVLVPSYYHFNQNKKDDTFLLETKVYAFKSIEQFKKAYEKNQLVPYWARGQIMPQNADIDPLSLVLTKTFELPVNQRSDSDRYLNYGKDLAKGYYLIQSDLEGQISQTFIQVTDIAVFVMNSNTGYFIWAKDIVTSDNIENAVLGFDSGMKYYTDKNGSIFANIENLTDSNMAVLSKDNDAIIINLYDYQNNYKRYYGSNAEYWNVLMTDRNLYKPDDTVSFYGFIKPRYDEVIDLDQVTVEISRGGYYPYYDRYYEKEGIRGFYYPGMFEPMLKQTFLLDGNYVDGSIKLPNLSEGSYNLAIKNKDVVIASKYISIENFVKPSYKIEMTKSKNAIFLGEPIEFYVRSAFFEGTPVSNLEFRADIGNHFGAEVLNIVEKTDIDGNYTITYTPGRANKEYQGMQYAYISVSSSIPEMGEIYINNDFYVFINDIWANYDSVIKDGIGKLKIDVNYVDLTKFNESIYENWNNFMGEPAAGKKVTGTLYKNEYVKQKTGEYYDFINKIKRSTYSYERIVTTIDSFTLITDQKGSAAFEFAPQESSNYIYYTAEFELQDSNERTIKNTAYFSNQGSSERNVENYYDDYSRLEISGDGSFLIGEKVQTKYIHLGEEITDGSYAYVLLQNGIRNVDFIDSSRYDFTFSTDMMPGMGVGGIFFTGKNFEYVQGSAAFDYSKMKIELSAELDKETYRPGDEAEVTITAKDINGEPITAMVNIAVVDEALFALNEQYVDTLAELFSYVGNGVKYTYSTHTLDQGFYGPVYSGNDARDGRVQEETMAKSTTSMDMTRALDGGGDEAAYVRSEFKDTAFFRSIKLDENGMGTLSIKLPDNITSWRVTMQGISEELKAGSDKVTLDVSMPMFINYSLSDVFLLGDKPKLGVSVYGTALKEGELVKIRVEGIGSSIEYEVKAFDRIYIPLSKLDKSGEFELTITAIGSDGESDAVLHKYKVIDSYHEIDVVDTKKAFNGMTLPRGEKGLTRYSFTDASTGKYANTLYSLVYSGGNRLEQKVVSKMAADMVRKYFDDGYEYRTLDIKEYQKEDGGLAFLPYGNSDIFTTVSMLPYVLDEIDLSLVKMYLYTVLDSIDQPNSKAAALYGLSILGEPILINLNEFEKIQNQDIVDRIYTALAYVGFNEIPVARRIYSQYIEEKVLKTETNARLEFGDDLDDRLKNTALLTMLAAKIGLLEQDALFNYINKEYSNEYLTMVEKLYYIDQQLEKTKPVTASLEYEYLGEKKKIEVGAYSRGISIPSQMADEFKILSVTGDVDVSASYKANRTLAGEDKNISITRQYSNYSRPGQPISKNDIIKVTLNTFISKNALDLGYEITDYLPSGLRAIENFNMRRDSYMYYYANTEGQKVFFSLYGDRKKDEYQTISYLARVVNPGEFVAEKPIMRGYSDKDLIYTGELQSIMISE